MKKTLITFFFVALMVNKVLAFGFPGIQMQGTRHITKLSNSGTSYYGGMPESEWAAGDVFTGAGATNGRTIVATSIKRLMRQDGYITKVVVEFDEVAASDTFSVRVFRKNGANYDFIDGSDPITIGAAGTNTYLLATPLSCANADVVGIHLNDTTTKVEITTTTDGVAAIRYTSGDITTTNSFSSTTDNFMLEVAFYGEAPFLAVTGDSIAEGQNEGKWYTYTHTSGISGDPEAEIMNQLKSILNRYFDNYQNHCKGAETFSWVASTGMPAAVATGARAVLVHCGINDVAADRTWNDIETNLDTIASLLEVGQHLFIDEILPNTNLNNTYAATIRTFNANLATWCAANDATLILSHDAMGQIRAGTGELDDLKTEYDLDGTHLLGAGVDKMAEIWKAALREYY